jgi:hypothetical protein
MWGNQHGCTCRMRISVNFYLRNDAALGIDPAAARCRA